MRRWTPPGNFIKAWRLYRGLTQRQLSTRAGVRQTLLARLEVEEADLTMSQNLRLCRALGITPDELWVRPEPALEAAIAAYRRIFWDRRDKHVEEWERVNGQAESDV